MLSSTWLQLSDIPLAAAMKHIPTGVNHEGTKYVVEDLTALSSCYTALQGQITARWTAYAQRRRL